MSPIFGHGGARTEAAKISAPFVGEVPLDMQIRITSDEGRPIVATEPDSHHAKLCIDMAKNIWSMLASGSAGKPPPRIVIE